MATSSINALRPDGPVWLEARARRTLFAPEGQGESSAALQCRVEHSRENPSRRDGRKATKPSRVCNNDFPCHTAVCATGRMRPAVCGPPVPGVPTGRNRFQIAHPALKCRATLPPPLRGKKGSARAGVKGMRVKNSDKRWIKLFRPPGLEGGRCTTRARSTYSQRRHDARTPSVNTVSPPPRTTSNPSPLRRFLCEGESF